MLESRGVTRKVEVACLVIALAIWIAGLAFGVQTMLGPRSRATEPNAYVPRTIQFYTYPDQLDDAYAEQPADAAVPADRQARVEAPAPPQP